MQAFPVGNSCGVKLSISKSQAGTGLPGPCSAQPDAKRKNRKSVFEQFPKPSVHKYACAWVGSLLIPLQHKGFQHWFWSLLIIWHSQAWPRAILSVHCSFTPQPGQQPASICKTKFSFRSFNFSLRICPKGRSRWLSRGTCTEARLGQFPPQNELVTLQLYPLVN